MAAEDFSADVSDAPRAHLVSSLHCHACLKVALDTKDLANFIILFWSRLDPKSGEPIIHDGIFDEKGKIAVLKACSSCGPKIKKLQKGYKDGLRISAIKTLNDGPLQRMLMEIRPRIKSSWKLEIGWEILLPILQAMKKDKELAGRVARMS